MLPTHWATQPGTSPAAIAICVKKELFPGLHGGSLAHGRACCTIRDFWLLAFDPKLCPGSEKPLYGSLWALTPKQPILAIFSPHKVVFLLPVLPFPLVFKKE